MADITPDPQRIRRRNVTSNDSGLDADDTTGQSTSGLATPISTRGASSSSDQANPVEVSGLQLEMNEPNASTSTSPEKDGSSSSSISSSSHSDELGSDEKHKEGRREKGQDGSNGRRSRFGSISQRIKSPLMSTINLGEMRDTFSNSVETKFAPLHIPPHRRLQTLAVLTWALLIPLCIILVLLLMSFPRFWPSLALYFAWIFYDKAHENGGRPKVWARRFFLWKYFADYYPCSIVKEADLPSDRPYLFGYHPHGIIGMGAFATFATEGNGFSENFPGITPHLLTLDSNFKVPFYREFIMFHGIASVSKPSCANILSKGPGTSITIVIGGASESLSAHPGTADLTLNRRFGFIKMAMRHGADLVPVFSFGENDIFDQLNNDKGSILYKLQRNFQKLFGFTLPLFYGRGVFNYWFGLMPFRHPIVTVFGRPINVTQKRDPSDEEVQKLHKVYIDELMRIWDKYKDLYAKNRTKELTIVD